MHKKIATGAEAPWTIHHNQKPPPGPELNHKVISYAEQNVASAFAFARKLLEVENPQDLFMLQTEFVRAQMQAMVEQANDLTATATMSIMNSARIPSAPSS